MSPDVRALLEGVSLLDMVIIISAIGAVLAGVKWVLPAARRVSDFLDDWNGEKSRPGHPGRPGAMARLEALEDRMTAAAVEARLSTDKISALEDTGRQTALKVDEIQKNVKPNGGLSAHDLLTRRIDGMRELVADTMQETGKLRRDVLRAIEDNHPDYSLPDGD